MSALGVGLNTEPVLPFLDLNVCSEVQTYSLPPLSPVGSFSKALRKRDLSGKTLFKQNSPLASNHSVVVLFLFLIHPSSSPRCDEVEMPCP